MPKYLGGNYISPEPYRQSMAGGANYVDATGATVEVPDSALPVSYVAIGALITWLLYRSFTKEERASKSRMGRGPARVYTLPHKPRKPLEKARYVIKGSDGTIKSKHGSMENAQRRLRQVQGYDPGARIYDMGRSTAIWPPGGG